MNSIKQNSEYTFKYNRQLGRHGWLRLTPAYSVKIVEQILSELNYNPMCVLEPFSGTGTTELVCTNNGISSIAYDINPFLVWLAKVKNTVYSADTLSAFKETALEIANNITTCSPSAYPPIYNIERWWNQEQLDYLARLKTAIWEIKDQQVSDLLKIAFCRQIITLSNASFNHVSTSFNADSQTSAFTEEDSNALFLSYCNMIMETAVIQPQKAATIMEQNSMYIPSSLTEKYDTIITSPPYPNRISYIRELRPYMYWLDYLQTPYDASELDWKTIGGTWGTATSRLSTWKRTTDLLPDDLYDTADRISHVDNKSADLMSNYVLKYFDDIANHIQTAYLTIKKGGTVHYIVGNSNFYGNVVPSDKYYKYILSKVGFCNAESRVIRKRNCNKALYEYWISAQK